MSQPESQHVNYRELTASLDRLRGDIVGEIRVVGTVMDRRFDRLDGRIGAVEIKLAAHEQQDMHEGTRHEFGRITEVLDKLGDQVVAFGKLVAYGAGAGAVLFILAQVILATVLR